LTGSARRLEGVRVVFITTVPETARSFLSQQVAFLNARGFEVHTITSRVSEEWLGTIEIPGITHHVAMRREISPLDDLLSVSRLWRLLRRLRPQIVHTHTPKAGLLGMIAASLARVPVRVYTVNGIVILTQSFWRRVVLACTEWLACRLASEVLCVSRSVRRFIIASGFCAPEKCRILGDGGSHGVDTEKFNPAVRGPATRTRIRNEYEIPEDALLLGYIGRLVPDKGIAELALAWTSIRNQFPQVRLLVCGYCEHDHPLPPGLIDTLRNDPRVRFTGGVVKDMPHIYSAIDICILPSYREGLPNVALECAAMQLPIVTTRVAGCVDSVRNGITGLIVQPRDPEALAAALRRLIENPALRQTLGVEARRFVSRRFSENKISQLLLQEYARLMKVSPGDVLARRAAAS
jgi:glycosyltransferase involved in cell wall biosynthesis